MAWKLPTRGLIRGGHQSYRQAFCFCESGLTLVRGQENLAFKQQGARDVKEIYSPSTGLLRMRRGQFASSIHGEIHVHDQFFQCASRYPGNHARQGSVSFLGDSRSLARWEHSSLVKGSLPNSIFHFQCV